MDNQNPQQQAPTNLAPSIQNQPTHPVDQKPPKSFFLSKFFLLIIISIIIFVGGGTYLALNSKSKPKPAISETIQSSPTPAPDTLAKDIFEKGFYINRNLEFSFNYPTTWILAEKTIDRKGNLNNLTFYLKTPQLSDLSQPKSLTVSVTKDDGENFSDFAAQIPRLIEETKKMGSLTGNFYSGDVRGEYWAIFVSTIDDVKYGFVLLVPTEQKGEYISKFEELISLVRINDSRAASLPEYFRDNLALDKKISQPSYIPSPFSITYEEQKTNIQKWKYSMNVTELSSGPNNLNIYAYRIGARTIDGSRKFIANLDNILEEKSIYQPVVEKGVAKVEPIETNGLKGYYINIGQAPENSFGSLIFATDKVVVSIDYIDGKIFNKDELLEIATSMIHL